MNTYEQWVKAERDSRGIEHQKLLDAEARGIEKGMQQEKLEIAKSMLPAEIPQEKVAEFTGLDHRQIEKLLQELSLN